MPAFSKTGAERLATCHPDLQRLFNEVVKSWDCSIICGHRDKAAQDEAVRCKRSKEPWPKSKHNAVPSLAVDVLPYPFAGWDDKESMADFAAFVKKLADQMGIKIRWGGDWNGNGDWRDERFLDMPHFELRL